MNADLLRDTYRRMIAEFGEPIILRRYTGQGVNRPRFDVSVRAVVRGYEADELVGTIVQGDRKVIILAQDLIDAQFALPIKSSDKVVTRGKEMAIVSPDDSTRRIGAALIAYELQASG